MLQVTREKLLQDFKAWHEQIGGQVRYGGGFGVQRRDNRETARYYTFKGGDIPIATSTKIFTKKIVETHAINVPTSGSPLWESITSICDLCEGGFDIVVELCLVSNIDLVPVGMGERAACVADLGSTGNEEGAKASGVLQGDDTVDGTGEDTVVGCTGGVAFGRATASGGSGDALRYKESFCLGLGKRGTASLFEGSGSNGGVERGGDGDERSELIRRHGYIKAL
ncbi:peptidoglycan-binding domain 1 protein [Moniliophthora roreri]|nr:peptidoglycan-binding domain 1 protein [Moniliophthora roreri]